eukprot:scaffold234701_cov20-Prasinocladus_malaysianus.AAC.1
MVRGNLVHGADCEVGAADLPHLGRLSHQSTSHQTFVRAVEGVSLELAGPRQNAMMCHIVYK